MKFFVVLFSMSLLGQDLDRTSSRFSQFNLSQDAVSFSFPIENGEPIAQSQPFVASSRGYTISFDEKTLFQGVPIHVSEPGPILVLSNKAGRDFFVDQLVLVGEEGVPYFAEEAFDLAEEQERRSPTATQTFRIRQELGVGTFYLVGDQLPDEEVRFTLAVLEPQSPVRVSAQATSDRFFVGDEIQVQIKSNLESLTHIKAQLYTSQGDQIQRSFAQDTLRFPTRGLQGLVEVRIEAEGVFAGQIVRRDMKTLVHVTVPTARIIKKDSGRRGESVFVEVAQAGRYEVRGFWQEKKGESMVPVQAEHQARWLGPGVHTFQFPPLNSGKHISFGNLQLYDQTQMALLEHLP